MDPVVRAMSQISNGLMSLDKGIRGDREAMQLYAKAEDAIGKLALHLADQGHQIEF